MNDTLSFFKNVPLFQTMTDEEVSEVAGYARELSYSKGTTIFEEDDHGDNFYIIKKGKVEISKMSYSGKEKTLAVLSSGDFFGEMALLDEELRSATVEALEDTTLLVIGRDGVETAVRKNPKVLLQMALILVKRLRRAGDLISQMEKVQEMHNRIMEAQDNERKRIARDVHDGPAQRAANLVMRADICKMLMDKDKHACLQELDDMKVVAQDLLKDIRNFIFDLRPLILDAQGLVACLQDYLKKYETENKIQTHLEVAGTNDPAPRFHPNVEKGAFGVVQEAMNNIKKYAQAKDIWVKMEVQPDMLVVTVKDNGKGFDVKAVKAQYENRRSLGLVSMTERAQLIGATFDIDSEVGKGATVSIRAPLKQDDSAEEGG